MLLLKQTDFFQRRNILAETDFSFSTDKTINVQRKTSQLISNISKNFTEMFSLSKGSNLLNDSSV